MHPGFGASENGPKPDLLKMLTVSLFVGASAFLRDLVTVHTKTATLHSKYKSDVFDLDVASDKLILTLPPSFSPCSNALPR